MAAGFITYYFWENICSNSITMAQEQRDGYYFNVFIVNQQTFNYLESTTKTLQKGVEYFQSQL